MSTTPATKNDIPLASAAGLIADLARAGTAPEILKITTEGFGDGLPPVVPIAWNRNAQTPVTLETEIERYRLLPKRRAGTAKVETLASFIELVKRHKDEDSAIFAETQWPNPKLISVIDYHQLDGTPDWLRHRVLYSFPLTQEFKTWIELDGKAMEQVKFAAFLEEHAAELASPMDGERSEYEPKFKERFAEPNELIALSRELEVYVGAKAKQGVRLQSGERTIEFTTEHTNAKGEKIDIPGIFMVSVPPFLDGEPVRIPARIRYRIAGGEVLWFYQLYRWEFWLRDRVQNDLLIACRETGLPGYQGTPEA